MTKTTTVQAIEAIKAAITEDAIKDVLMTCTKVVMCEVHDAITGTYYTGPALKLKKAEFANWVTKQIMKLRADEAFNALPYEEKFRAVMDSSFCFECLKKFDLFTLTELEETARRLGVPARGEKDEIIDDLVSEIATCKQVSKLKRLMSGDDVDAVRDELSHASCEVLTRLCRPLNHATGDRTEMNRFLLEYYKDHREAMNTTAVEEALVRAEGKAQRLKIFLGMSERQMREYMVRNDMPIDTCADLMMSAITATSQALEQLKTSSYTSTTPLSQAFNRVNTPVKFQIGHHYRENGATPQEIYTLIERIGDCGYFVDTFNVYHRRNIRASGMYEYANSPCAKGANTASTLRADSEVPVHEIISEKNGNASVILHTGQVNSSEELESLLKGAASKKEQAKELPAIEESIVRAKDGAGIQTILEALTTDELKVYAARNLLTGKISLNGDMLTSLVRATEDTLELFRKMRESGSEIGTPTTPLSKAWSELQALKSRRKGLQQELHKLWLKRRAVMKAQRTAKISREEYETLGEMWEHASVELSRLFEDYRQVCCEMSERRCEHEEISSGCEEGISNSADAGARRGAEAA